MDKKKKTKQRIIALAVMMVILLLLATAISAHNTYKTKRQNEKYSETNSAAVMKALASGDSKKLESLLIDPEGAAALMEYADWKNADFDKAVSMGSGSLSDGPDKQGMMDISERFFVDIGDVRYLLFIESSTSRWGRENDGVSAVAATTLEH